MPGAWPQALARHKQSPGLFVSGLSPPPSAYGRRLLLYFPDSLPHHPRLASTVPCSTPPTAALPRRCTCVLLGKHQPPSGRGWAAGCGAYAAPRSTELVARALQRAACSDSLRLSERSERSSRSEFCNGAMRSSTGGHPACKAGRCIRSRRRRPTRGPSPHSNAVHNGSLIERLLCAVSSREALRNRRRTCVSSARCETPPRWPTGWASAAPRGRAADQSCR